MTDTHRSNWQVRWQAVGALATVAAVVTSIVLATSEHRGQNDITSMSHQATATEQHSGQPGAQLGQTFPVNHTSVPLTSLGGTWQGTAQNQNGVTYPVQLVISAAQTTAALTYGAPAHCSEVLTWPDSTATHVQTAVPATPTCTPGHITVDLRADGRLDYTFVSLSTRYTIVAVLART
jgi:hypothetical protein